MSVTYGTYLLYSKHYNLHSFAYLSQKHPHFIEDDSEVLLRDINNVPSMLHRQVAALEGVFRSDRLCVLAPITVLYCQAVWLGTHE